MPYKSVQLAPELFRPKPGPLKRPEFTALLATWLDERAPRRHHMARDDDDDEAATLRHRKHLARR